MAKRTFTKYPQGYIKAASNYQDDEASVWHVDFYRMISDLTPLYTVYVEANTKEDAYSIGEQLAEALGYNPEKIVVQFAHMSQMQFDEYYVPRKINGIQYFVRNKYT